MTKLQLWAGALFVVFLAAMGCTAQNQEVTVYSDRDFKGKSQSFGPGTYRADRHQLDVVGNDAISSVRVPFGMTVDLYEWEEGNKPPFRPDTKAIFTTGDQEYVGDAINDKTSMIIVYPHSSTYFSTDDPMVPSNTRVTVTRDWELIIDVGPGDDPEKYYKTFTYTIPSGCDVGVWEATKNPPSGSRSGWTSEVRDGKLKIRLWVYIRGAAGVTNWVGVNFKCK